jgi:hypothetical protein
MENTVKRKAPNSATTIGANTMFLQIDKRHSLVSALQLFFPTLPIIWAQVVAKHFLLNSRWWSFKIKKECSAPQHYSNTCRLIPIFDHLSFRWTIL